MQFTMKRNHTLVFCGLLLCAAGARPARAEATAETVTVDIEVAEPTRKEALAITLTLAGEHGCASVKEHRGTVAYEVEACREGGEPSASVLKFKIDRTDNTKLAVLVPPPHKHRRGSMSSSELS